MVFVWFFTLLVVIFVISYFLGWSFLNWRDSCKSAGVRMSFGEFRRIYELAPSKWDRYSDYTFRREDWIRLDSDRENFFGTYISTAVAMKTLFDFWKLLFWQDEIDRKREREECLKKEKACLKSLSIMVENDVGNIRKKLEEEEQKAENLRQEIIDRLEGR